MKAISARHELYRLLLGFMMFSVYACFPGQYRRNKISLRRLFIIRRFRWMRRLALDMLEHASHTPLFISDFGRCRMRHANDEECWKERHVYFSELSIFPRYLASHASGRCPFLASPALSRCLIFMLSARRCYKKVIFFVCDCFIVGRCPNSLLRPHAF